MDSTLSPRDRVTVIDALAGHTASLEAAASGAVPPSSAAQRSAERAAALQARLVAEDAAEDAPAAPAPPAA
jgi:hypothetical protein